MAAAAQATRASRVDKWSNWQTAVETGSEKEKRVRDHRVQRVNSAEELAAQVPSAVAEAVAEKFAVCENGGVRASFERYGRWSTEKFQQLAMLGEGAFGVVHLVRHKDTNELFAVKQMDKTRYQQKNRQRVFTERDVLSEASSRWCVELFATFQDSGNVYMVMEFVQGGDLIWHLQQRKRFTFAETAFYMAELLQALDTIHQCKFIHRDVKPDNMVIGVTGHLKLLDFGLSKSDAATSQPDIGADFPQARGQERLHSIAGTPQYMAPEGFSGAFSAESDLWALGIIAFECLAGVVPFHAGRAHGPEAIRMIKDKILHHEDLFPARLDKARRLGFTNAAAERFLRGMICSRDKRLNAAQVRQEPFFSYIDFPNLHLAPPPFVPQVSSPEDVSHFDDFKKSAALPKVGPRLGWDSRLEWVHYELDGRVAQAQKPALPDSLDEQPEIFEM